MPARRATHDRDLTAAILAGGVARRMGGADKSSLPLGGERILDRQLSALRTLTDSILVVGGAQGRYEALGLRTVPDAIPAGGAMAGIYSAIVASPHAWTLVVACDMPFLSAPLLLELAARRSALIDVVMPRTPDGLQPLCALYSERCAPSLRSRLERGLLRASEIVGDVRVEELGPDEIAAYDPDGLMFVNVNTPHDYERAKEVVDRERRSRAALRDPITDATA
ncbi:MAG TPA: molybdenum cofactor guanylyltransferase [Vicinamibacterales bacterium]|jgi:molybdopterin-guanine dinucleotide biosynthesis protein A|nr:molybdenum cofactor guanylyltransferase [Vicinamibacterales bacterium]